MTEQPVSIVIVSRGRPRALRQCLAAVALLDHPAYEVIVVACAEGVAAAQATGLAAHLKIEPFAEANISAARNAGIARAAGEIVAFLDDDAVPEPRWLALLCAPLETTGAAAAGGFVRGRNGISFQWRARSVDACARTAPLRVDPERPTLLSPPPDRAVKTEGTNMAVRRDVLAGMGGFDPAYRFFLDETDLNLRLARAGLDTAIVPRAEVHHGYLESPRRGRDRVPRELREIGASLAVFLRRHAPPEARAARMAEFRAEQRARLLRHMVRGPLGPDDMLRLMRGLEAGLAEGATRALGPLPPLPHARDGFLPFPGGAGRPPLVLSGSWRARRKLRRKAVAAARAGHVVSLFLFSHTTLYHRVRFHPEGIWEQSGGLYGRSDRDGPLFQRWRRADRVTAEGARVGPARGLPAAKE